MVRKALVSRDNVRGYKPRSPDYIRGGCAWPARFSRMESGLPPPLIVEFEDLRCGEVSIVDPHIIDTAVEKLIVKIIIAYRYILSTCGIDRIGSGGSVGFLNPIHIELNFAVIRAAIIGNHRHHMMPLAIEDIGGAHSVSAIGFEANSIGGSVVIINSELDLITRSIGAIA